MSQVRHSCGRWSKWESDFNGVPRPSLCDALSHLAGLQEDAVPADRNKRRAGMAHRPPLSSASGARRVHATVYSAFCHYRDCSDGAARRDVAAGMFAAWMFGNIASYESQIKAARVKRAMEQKIRAGQFRRDPFLSDGCWKTEGRFWMNLPRTSSLGYSAT